MTTPKIETVEPLHDMGWVTTVNLPRPSLQDNTADMDRLCQSIRQAYKADWAEMDLALARQLPALLKENHYEVRCVVIEDQQQSQQGADVRALGRVVILEVQPAASEAPVAGLAVDLGTTRVVLRLVDLVHGRVLAETAFDNPQMAVGPDILVRIHYADQEEGRAELQHLIVESINTHAAALCRIGGISAKDIYLFSVAGNTTMSHMLVGLPVQSIIREPYLPVANRFGLITARELGLKAHQRARVMVFPCAGSYLGGDVIAGILYSGMDRAAAPALLVDVGTNAEVVLGNRDWLMACAGAAGPALEGGMSRIGSTAKPGAIDRVGIDPDSRKWDIHTIEGLLPAGICGSGIIDLAAGLFGAGMIDMRGKIQEDPCQGRLRVKDGQPHVIVVPAAKTAMGRDLCISQADLDSLVRSKAAMFTILETITTTMGMALSQIETFFVAGTFGSFINPRSAITIGMLPDLPETAFRNLGNSSLGGATMALLSREHWRSIPDIRNRVTYLELNVNQDFMNRFSAAKFLPHTDPGRFPSVAMPKP